LPDGKKQLNGITIDDREETGLSQQLVAPVLMGLEPALQQDALWQPGKRVSIIAVSRQR
jgi:hypothetical protein